MTDRAINRTSLDGIVFIRAWEQFRSKPYRDQAGHWTIGFGHRITKEEKVSYIRLTREEAKQLLLDDLDPVRYAIVDNVTTKLSQRQFDALSSLIFNIGVHAFERSTLLKLLNRGNYQGAADEFIKEVDGKYTGWIYITKNKLKKQSKGLIQRRLEEKKMFKGEDYDVPPTYFD